MIWKANRRINMQSLRNTYAEHTLMPHFGGGEKASVETGGWATGWAAAESACIGATTAGGATNGCCETDRLGNFQDLPSIEKRT